MKVVKHTGLVPVKALVRFKGQPSGRTFGIDPALVHEAIAANQVELAEIPEGIEIIDIADLVEKAPDPRELARGGEEVVIPDDWETLHYLKVVALAKAIHGGELPKENDKKPTEIARGIILAELDRRTAPEGEGGSQEGQSGDGQPDDAPPANDAPPADQQGAQENPPAQ